MHICTLLFWVSSSTMRLGRAVYRRRAIRTIKGNLTTGLTLRCSEMSLPINLKVAGCLISLCLVLQLSLPTFAQSIDTVDDGIVGLRLDHTSSNFEVFDVVENSPSAKAGILKGDQVIEVGGVKTANLKFADVINKVRGKVGSTVKLNIVRAGKPIEFTLVRVREMPREVSFFGSNSGDRATGSWGMQYSRRKNVNELPPTITKSQGDLKPTAILWEPDLRTALVAAKETKKRVLLYLTAKG